MPLQSNFQLVLEHLHQSKFVQDNTYILQQLLPLVFVLLVPLFILTARSKFSALFWTWNMLLENLGLSYAWNAVHDHFASSSSHTSSKKKSSTKHKRTKSQSTRSSGSAGLSYFMELCKTSLYLSSQNPLLYLQRAEMMMVTTQGWSTSQGHTVS